MSFFSKKEVLGPSGKPIKSNFKKELKENFFAYLYLLPVLLLIIVFSYYPFIRTVVFSFSQVTSFGEWRRFTGIENYIYLFQDTSFINSLIVTGRYLLFYLPLHIVTTLTLALITNRKKAFSTLYQTMIAAPMAVSMAVACSMFGFLYYNSEEIAAMVAQAIGLGVDGLPVWIDQAFLGVPIVAFITLWAGVGFDYLLLLAAVRGVPEDLLENASLAGAGRFRKFYHITLPIISPTLFFVICTQTIASVLILTPFTILDNGGLFGSMTPIQFYILEMGFRQQNYSNGSAASVISFLVTLLFVLFNFYYEKKAIFYE